jgi:hypothetical protein
MKNETSKGSIRRLFKCCRSLSCVATCAVILAQVASAANPTVYEQRIIQFHKVDLLPLFDWWDKRQGARPLSTWKHIEGFLDRESAYGWLVRGTIEGQNGLQYFLLKNPPRKEIARYRELENSLPNLEQERASALEVTKLPAYKGWDWDVNGGMVRLPSEDYDRVEKAQVNLEEVDGRIQAVRQEMAGMLDGRGNFKVDAFALQLNESYQGSQVFDFGFPPY